MALHRTTTALRRSKRTDRGMSHATPSFLIINVARIGDTLLATPALRSIAAAYPGCHITALAHPKRAEVLEGLPFLERVGGITKNSALWRGRMGGARYDYALVYGFDESLVRYALRVAKRVVAFRQHSQALNQRLYRYVEEQPKESLHAVKQRLALVEAIGIPGTGGRLSYQITADEAADADKRLASEVPVDASPLIGINVATFPTKLFRRWPIEQFGELCEHMLAEWPNAHVLIFGGSDERADARALHQRLGRRATLFAGRLNLRESGALMSKTDLYIGLDTGPTHLMSAFTIPMVVLYHCRIPSRNIAPLEHPALYVIDHPRLGGNCTDATPMSEITVDTVLDRVRRALRDHPPRHRVDRLR